MSIPIVVSTKRNKEPKETCFAKSYAYLPKEGLQGEDIPSHILWENINVESIEVSFSSPLRFKEIFNAESWKAEDNKIFVKKTELGNYIGLTFGSCKVSSLEAVAQVKYLLCSTSGSKIELKEEIKLFRPQLSLKVQNNPITITPQTGYVRNRIKIENIGRGTLIIYVHTEEDSQIKIETSSENQEFAEKFLSDLGEELSNLTKDFPQFQSVLESILKMEAKDAFSISEEEKNQVLEYVNKLREILASNKDFLDGFMNAYGKALAKNSEFVETIRRVVRLYESLVSKSIFLVNPFDEIRAKKETTTINLRISQTDKVRDSYEEIQLQKIELVSSEETRTPIYKLFEWR